MSLCCLRRTLCDGDTHVYGPTSPCPSVRGSAGRLPPEGIERALAYAVLRAAHALAPHPPHGPPTPPHRQPATATQLAVA